MRPRVLVIDQKEQASWWWSGKRAMSFDETTKLIHDLQNGLFDLRSKERFTGETYYLILLD